MLSYLKYITNSEFSGNIKTDVKDLLYLSNKQKTFEHVQAVAETGIKIAEQYGLDKNICELCGYWHDVSAIFSYDYMMKYAVENNWVIYEAESKFPILLHQRISRVIAEEDFKIADERILSAVECHTTLKANPSKYDMALFVADKLAWDLGFPPFYDIVSDALKISLEKASLAYQNYIVEHKMIYYPHKWFEESVKFLSCM